MGFENSEMEKGSRKSSKRTLKTQFTRGVCKEDMSLLPRKYGRRIKSGVFRISDCVSGPLREKMFDLSSGVT